MHVLQRAIREVAPRVHAEQRAHFLVPQCRDVFRLDLALDQGLLDLVAQDHVRRIRALVGIDADVAGRHTRQQLVEVGRLEGRLRTEVLGEQGRQQLRERRVAAQLHLEAQALALVQAHGARLRHRLAEQRARQVLLVARMAGLVNGAHQAGQQIVLAVARGQAHVFRHAAGERMRALVQAAGLEVEIEQAHHVLAQCTLRGDGERAHRLDKLVLGLALLRPLDQARQPLAQIAEQAVELRAGHAGLETIEQRVIGAQTRLVGEQLGLFAPQAQHLAEVLEKARPVVGRPLLAPGVLAARGGQRLLLDQRLRQRVARAPVAADLAQVRALRVVERLAFRLRDQALEPRLGAHAVQQGADLGQRGGARLVALGRHVGRLVPRSQRVQMAEAVQAGVQRGQFVVGSRAHEVP